MSGRARGPLANGSLAGKLIAFEGADGAGKTTLVRTVGDSLRARGIMCEWHAFPGAEDGTIGRLVYELHHDLAKHGLRSITPTSLQTLHVAAHVDAIERRIQPVLESGACVLLDRFWWSTWVYGIVAGVPATVLRALIGFERLVWNSTRPKAVVLVTRPGAGDPALEAEYDRLATRERRSVRVVRVENNSGIELARDVTIAALLSHSRSTPSRTGRRRGSQSPPER
jgi:hypothetical protein